ncbi:MAG: MarR family transcriptional regulator [Rhodospirillales bacterium]|jgi:DNA-binding MarR family transcriptional regulator|nr:MarR family transcriptional regulator [Rhodospirillales bacterium]MDB5382639.1 MarR family transcriptional regulator [Rhodospirillales bacterium]
MSSQVAHIIAIRPDAGYRLDESVGHLLRRAHQRHVAQFQIRASEHGLTPPQFAALLRLVELGNVTQNRLGRLVAMDPATIQGVVRRLLARDLVVATRDPMDRRTVVLSPTETGRLVADVASRRAQSANESVLACLTEDERIKFLAMLRRVAGA